MGPYLAGLVVVAVIWLAVVVDAIIRWNEAKTYPRYASDLQQRAKRMLWALLGVFLVPVYPLSIPGALLLGIILLIRAGIKDTKNGATE